jgi:hypothetical protein
LPPVVHALTVHWTARPRSLLACAPATWTQRLTCGSCGTVLAPLCELVRVGVGVAVGVGFLVTVRVGVGVALSEALGVLVLVADADGLAYDVLLAVVGVSAGFVGDSVHVFVGVCDGGAAGLDVSVLVGAGVGSDGVVPELVAPDGDGLVDWLVLALALVDLVGDGLVVVLVGVLAVGVGVSAVEVGVLAVEVGVLAVEVDVVGVAVGVVGVAVGVVGVALGVVGGAVGVGAVEVGEGDGLGGEAGS